MNYLRLFLSFIIFYLSFKYRKSLQQLNDNIFNNQKYPQPITKDDLMITRLIIDNYKLANANNTREIYKVSPIWYKGIYKSRIHYVEALKREETYHLSVLLRSFFRNIGAVGITYKCRPFRGVSKLNYSFVIQTDKMYQHLRYKEKDSRISFKHLFNTNDVGNPYLVQLYGQSLDINTLCYLTHVYEIIRHTDLDMTGKYIFADLGAGFGCTIKFLLQLFPNSKAIVFDLPEMLPFSTYFLNKNFKQKKIGLYTDIKSINEDIIKYDILLLPHFMIEEIPSNVIDCFVNMASLPEMPRSVALNYLKYISKAVKHNGYFYLYNCWDNASRINNKGEHGLKELFEASSIYNYFEVLYNDVLEVSQEFKEIIMRKR